MNTHSFGMATAAIIVLTALAFLGLFAAGHVASPTLMTPWSSLAYLVIGCSLLIDSSSGNGAPLRAGGLLAFAIGAVVCGEYLAGVGSTAFDRLIFPSHLPADALLPGRPAPIAGFRFCTLGAVMFLARSRNKLVVLVREWGAIAVLVMCYFGFISVVIEWGTASPKSISPAAGVLGMLSAGNLLATGQNSHFLPLLRDRGPAGMIARSLMPAAMVLPVLYTLLGLVFAHFRIYERVGQVALVSLNMLAALTILWVAASKVQAFDLLRSKAEDALRASAARMKLAQQVSQVGTFEWNIQTGVNLWTPDLEAMYGLPPGSFAGTQQAWAELLDPHDRPGVEDRVREALVTGDFEGEWRVTWPDGSVRWLVGRASVLRDGSGQPLRMIGIQMDVTDRKRAQEELRESNDRFRNMADHAPVMIWVSGPDKRATFFNRRWLDFVGRTMDEESGNGWMHSVHPDDLKCCLSAYAAAFDARRSYQREYRLRRADGEYRWVLGSGVPRMSEGGVFTGFVGSCIDITDAKRTQEQVFHAQKLESLGVLAGGVAHDFNNLLGAILIDAESVLLDLAPGSPGRREAEHIRIVAHRASIIVRQLMAYAGKDTTVFDAVDVGRLITDVLDLLKVSISRNATLMIHLADGLPAVRANAAQLQQVFMNLLTNASEALGETGGVITVSAARSHLSSVGGAPDLPDGDYIRLEVSDTGCGMKEDIQARIFDPFYSTKFDGRGLGLAAVRGIIRDHGGSISLVSAPGKGTSFTLLLPCAPESATLDSVGAGAAEGQTVAAAESILVIEDEELLRGAVSKVLRKKGFPVFAAADGQAGLDLFQTHGPKIRLVLLDTILPGLSSGEVLTQLRQLQTGVKVILTTAYSEAEAMSAIGGQPVSAFIRKPYSVEDLSTLIRKVLSA